MKSLIQANALRLPLADESVNCCVTSPPYYGLRDYGSPDQIGLEPTPEDYVANMLSVFREVWRVLRRDGTLWLNLGDTYANDNKWGGASGNKNYTSVAGGYDAARHIRRNTGRKPKNLIGVPWLVALALQSDGWYLRQDIIWHKPNAMPENVKDRPSTAHENVFLFTKHEHIFLMSKRAHYYYDFDDVKEPAITGDNGSRFDTGKTGEQTIKPYSKGDRTDDGFRNLRSVWSVPTCSYPGSHFATFPPALIEPMIKAGCPADGVVLDPFVGSGTTVQVARNLGRRAIGLDINAQYLNLAEDRVCTEFGELTQQEGESLADLPMFEGVAA